MVNISSRPVDQKLGSIILKVANACNLACPYCFMFRSVDRSYQSRPRLMTPEVIRQATQRIREHIRTHDIDELELIIHGGEPLLLGHKRLEFLLEELSGLRDSSKVSVSIQTNGSLLSMQSIRMFEEHDVKVGVSLDGYPELQNKTKLATGGDSYPAIFRGIQLLQEELGPQHFRGLLAVIDLEGDPVRVYDHFLELGIKRMDFLLPLRNHKYPIGYDPESKAYFCWLQQLFDRYFQDDDETIEIRIFDSIIDLLLGAQLPMCSIRHSALDILVIETSGSIELVDDLRICGNDFTNLGLNVQSNTLAQFFDTRRFSELLLAERHLPTTCRTCKHLNVCGSGGHAFRYGADDTWNHPSIYCEDTAALIQHIADAIFEEKPEEDADEFYARREVQYRQKYFGKREQHTIHWTNGFASSPTSVYAAFLTFIHHDGAVLDLGCGNGMLLRYLTDNLPHKMQPFGVDFLDEAIEQARTTVFPEERDNFTVGSICRFPIEHYRFDFILLDPHHLAPTDRSQIVARLRRRIRPGGRLVVYSYHDAMDAEGSRCLSDYRGMEGFELLGERVIPDQVSIAYLPAKASSRGHQN